MPQSESLWDRVKIRLDKEPGDETFRCQMEASSPSAAIQGVIAQILQLSNELEMPVISVLSVITTKMVGELTEEEEA